MASEKVKSAVAGAGIAIGTEFLISLLRLIFAEYRRRGMTPEETKVALLVELDTFEGNPPNKIPDV